MTGAGRPEISSIKSLRNKAIAAPGIPGTTWTPRGAFGLDGGTIRQPDEGEDRQNLIETHVFTLKADQLSRNRDDIGKNCV